MSNTSNIRVSSYTHEQINKHSKRLKMNQGELVELAIEIAQINNFEKDLARDFIVKSMKIEVNRLIGFLKIQDKNLLQVQQNILDNITGEVTTIDTSSLDEFYTSFQHHFKENLVAYLQVKYHNKVGAKQDIKKEYEALNNFFNPLFFSTYENVKSEYNNSSNV